MTLRQLIEQVHEKTHLNDLEIFAIVRENWPNLEQFSRTQEALLVRLIQKRTQPSA